MAFIKVGDEVPITECFDEDGEVQVCPACGEELHVIYVDEDSNQLVCDHCSHRNFETGDDD